MASGSGVPQEQARAKVFTRRAVEWLCVLVPAAFWLHWNASRLAGALYKAGSAFLEAGANPETASAPYGASAALHVLTAVAFVAASLALLGRRQPLALVGPPPSIDDASAASSEAVASLGKTGSFLPREPGAPAAQYCDGAEDLDNAERSAIDPLRPTVVLGASGKRFDPEAVGGSGAPGSAAAAAAAGATAAAVPADVVPAVYAAHGLGQVASGDAAALYADMVRRVVSGCVYQDPARIAYAADGRLYPSNGFSLAHRVVGADEPRDAMSWVGIRRLAKLQEAVESVVAEGVAGDVLECGVLFGGAAVAAKAVLRAKGADAGPDARRVLCADTFVPPAAEDFVPASERPLASRVANWAAVHALRAMALMLPDSLLQSVMRTVDAVMPDGVRSFPKMTDKGDLDPALVRWARCVMEAAGHPDVPVRTRVSAGLHRVRSHFARLGLLDDNVVFLRGFFSASLDSSKRMWPDGHPALRAVAVLRLDGDTYESTWTALEGAYERLSPRGFCIVDDYGSFPGCKRAVDQFRKERGITAPFEQIDAHAVQWRKGDEEPFAA
ncbi:hypothetical protein FNF29_07886 [Cafeteria roenbergensis]|nr:hypothetical protein FNF29_07886 [Cafeteria roenbergensis]|eukprot:KAA0146705.1 hypothetical protein FNF29_07886 [Cafeteria roenbergensis]